jgi:catechol 2,3-dioxygenase-like lactoylglutathione lyase family enzyme
MGVAGGPVRLVYLTDPDGVRIELMAGTPELPI